MDSFAIDLGAILAAIRARAIDHAAGAWPGLGEQLDSILPRPLNPMALLPVASGVAAGGQPQDLVDLAAVIVLTDLALRIADDCADEDDPGALHHALGAGQALQCALALQAVAARAIARAQPPALADAYFQAFLEVCCGQDLDLAAPAASLEDYQALVRLKGVAAYQFAAASGAIAVAADPEIVASCARCGAHLGWMAQILDDIEALWFPVGDTSREIEKMTFPLLLGFQLDLPGAAALREALASGSGERLALCAILDSMDVRGRLLSIALDHRDQALAALGDPLRPQGQAILQIWLDWLLRDGARLLDAAPAPATNR